MGNYQAYEKYKDSGVKWLGDIPKHWKKSVFRYYFDIQLGKMLQNESQSEHDEEISYLKAIHVRWDKVNIDDLPKMWTSPREKEKYSVRNGDLLISEGGEVGRTALLKDLHEDCIIQNAVHRVRALSQSKVEYLNYLMRHIADTKWLDILCNKSTIAHLTSEKLGALPLPLPPLDEQELIANFLDRKTKQIDDLIAKKEAILAKLDEKRSAIISHAVTKGLDPTVPMKDSGIEWLGSIPEHWNSIKTRYCSEFITSGSRGWSQYFSDNGSVFLRITNVSRDGINLKLEDIQRVTLPIDAEGQRAKVLSGDVIISITADLGSVAVIPNNFEKAHVSQHLALVRPFHHKVCSKWIAYQVFSITGKKQLLSSGYGGTKIQLSLTDIKDLWITLPSTKEQEWIIQNLEKRLVEINLQKAKVQEAIEHLKEYRTALITKAVTGKIDVRQVSLN